MTTQNPALSNSLLNFVKVSGKSLAERSAGFSAWVEARRSMEVWPYSRVLIEPALHNTVIADEFGRKPVAGINFASQDYLGLASRPELREAAHAAIDEFGVHSAGSPALCGRTRKLVELEDKFAALLGYEACIMYPTGWAAGFGVVTGLVREADTILIDALCHNCLQEGAKHAAGKLRKFAHNDMGQLEQLLREERTTNADGAVFVVVESLYSMDSDSPDLNAILVLARCYEAIVILDVAHDFGAMGECGLGLLETLPESNWREHVVVMGSFSKTFAANGGFVACSSATRQYLRSYSSPNIFSNAMSPILIGIVHRAFDIIFSGEGIGLRQRLGCNVDTLRTAMRGQGLTVAGTPSPIVPVFVGGQSDDDALARMTSLNLIRNGLHANLVEFPAVPRGKARFRFQVMATHEMPDIQRAAEIMAASRAAALKMLPEAREAPVLVLSERLNMLSQSV